MTKNFKVRLDNLPTDIMQQVAEIDLLKTAWTTDAELDCEVLTRLKNLYWSNPPALLRVLRAQSSRPMMSFAPKVTLLEIFIHQLLDVNIRKNIAEFPNYVC